MKILSVVYSWLGQLKIGPRIFFGFALMLIAIGLTSVFSLSSLHSISERFDKYAFLKDRANLIMAIDLRVEELQRQVESFSNASSSSLAQPIYLKMDALKSSLDSAKKGIQLAEEAELLNQMSQHLGVYRDTFEKAHAERDEINRLVFEEFPKIRRELVGIAKDTSLENEISTHAQESADLLYRYLLDPNYSLIKLGAKNFRARMAALEREGHKVKKALNDFHEAFLGIARANRNYLFLTNVVMGAESMQFAQASQRLKKLVVDGVDPLADEVSSKVQASTYFEAGISALLLLLGAIVAFLIARSITLPLSEMTNVFTRLVKGDHTAEIPGLGRRDEIGNMAKAADVFKAKNSETENLLNELARSNEELEQFAYASSHDLKAPLRAIAQLSNWVIDDCQDMIPAKSKQHLMTIKSRVERMSNLLEDILTYSRVGRKDESEEEINLAETTKEVVEFIDPPENFRFDIQEDSLPIVWAPKVAITQVLQNLITNGIKHNDKKEGVISISGSTDGEWVTIAVQDNGPGIEPKYQDRIFGLFQTLSSRDDVEGSGIGLSIVKKTVMNRGGQVWLESKPGEGTTFYFTWPCHRSDKTEKILQAGVS